MNIRVVPETIAEELQRLAAEHRAAWLASDRARCVALIQRINKLRRRTPVSPLDLRDDDDRDVDEDRADER